MFFTYLRSSALRSTPALSSFLVQTTCRHISKSRRLSETRGATGVAASPITVPPKAGLTKLKWRISEHRKDRYFLRWAWKDAASGAHLLSSGPRAVVSCRPGSTSCQPWRTLGVSRIAASPAIPASRPCRARTWHVLPGREHRGRDHGATGRRCRPMLVVIALTLAYHDCMIVAGGSGARWLVLRAGEFLAGLTTATSKGTSRR
jgi:hypothetical protein